MKVFLKDFLFQEVVFIKRFIKILILVINLFFLIDYDVLAKNEAYIEDGNLKFIMSGKKANSSSYYLWEISGINITTEKIEYKYNDINPKSKNCLTIKYLDTANDGTKTYEGILEYKNIVKKIDILEENIVYNNGNYDILETIYTIKKDDIYEYLGDNNIYIHPIINIKDRFGNVLVKYIENLSRIENNSYNIVGRFKELFNLEVINKDLIKENIDINLNNYAIIYSDEYNVERAIPTSENVNINCYIDKYKIDYKISVDGDIYKIYDFNYSVATEYEIKNELFKIKNKINIFPDIKVLVNDEKTSDEVIIDGKYYSGEELYNINSTKFVDKINNINLINRANKTYNSKFVVNYGNKKYLGEVNKIKIHTPIVSNSTIVNNVKYNQDVEDYNITMVIDTYSKIKINNFGIHINEKGYGKKNYDKYVRKNTITFPFDVIYDNKLYLKNKEIDLKNIIDEIYIPIYVKEGYYEIKFKSYAINEQNKNIENIFNKDKKNYIVQNNVTVKVVGRLFNFNIYDISDYPMYKTYFRMYDFSKTGNTISVGNKDRNGNKKNNVKLKLPVVEMDNDYLQGKGGLKGGYTIRFFIDLIGNENSKIKINPQFYIKKDGKFNKVDLYYKNLDKNIIKIDKNDNNFYINNILDFKVDLSDYELENLSVFDKSVDIYGYSFINLTKNSRTNIGHMSDLKDIVDINLAPFYLENCVGRYYGEYKLPDKYYIIYNNKLVDEDLYVKFDIKSFGKVNLLYENNKNCNMWKMEGYTNNLKVKINGKNKTYKLIDGIIGVYNKRKNIRDDYDYFGTH